MIDTGGKELHRVSLGDMNITNNLSLMAKEVSLYSVLWGLENNTIAGSIINKLNFGLNTLIDTPGKFSQMNPENGWGSYALLIRVVDDFLELCKQHPKALIEVSK